MIDRDEAFLKRIICIWKKVKICNDWQCSKDKAIVFTYHIRFNTFSQFLISFLVIPHQTIQNRSHASSRPCMIVA
jgi:hypothetical protein